MLQSSDFVAMEETRPFYKIKLAYTSKCLKVHYITVNTYNNLALGKWLSQYVDKKQQETTETYLNSNSMEGFYIGQNQSLWTRLNSLEQRLKKNVLLWDKHCIRPLQPLLFKVQQ